MFESLTESLGNALKKLTRRGKLTEKSIEGGLREVRRALLEADVNVRVVKDFINEVKKKAITEDVIDSVRPGQQIVKIVNDELVKLMGESDSSITRPAKGPAVIMMCGLQGSGKTTTCGKLARRLKKNGKKPLLVAADVQRPGAIDQLKILGDKLDVPVYWEEPGWFSGKPVRICRRAVKKAAKEDLDTVILDTAGRLHIDDTLMKELQAIVKKTDPHNIWLVCDAMAGQDAVNSAKEFNDRLELDGVVLTKLDGDARGGAALSIRKVTGKPIKFVGVGEQLDRLEEFHPDRMASRILGMGDVVSLVEKAQEAISEEKALGLQQKLAEDRYDFNDFLDQLQSIKKMGSLKDLLAMIPGMGSQLKGIDIDGSELKRIEAIIHSMTLEERSDPRKMNGSRRRRIANGSGTSIQEVNELLKQFKQMKSMVRQMSKMGNVLGKIPGLGNKFKGFKKKKKRRKPF